MPKFPSRPTTPLHNRAAAPAPVKSNRYLEYLTLALCGFLALAFAVLMPPLQVNDEDGHFIRAYVISRGEFVGRGVPALPGTVVSFVMRYPEFSAWEHKFTPQEIVHDLPASAAAGELGATALSDQDKDHKYLIWAIIGSSTYCPLVYLPASLGIWAARTLGTSPLVMMYAARISNVLIFVIALTVSFRLAPSFRAIMTAVALMPMTLELAGGISGDLVTIAISFVGLSLVLHAREYAVDRKFLIIVAVVFSMWVLCKFSIWALPLLWLIPASAFPSRRAWLSYIGGISICMLGALFIWNGINSASMEALRAARLAHGIDIGANVRLISAHPLAFTRQMLTLVHANYKTELRQFIGAFGWTNLSLPFWVRPLYLLLLVVVAAYEFPTKPFRRWERGFLLLVFLAGLAFVHVVIFISDGTVCANNLERLCFASSAGVQGRYFIPFCLAGLVILRQKRANLPQFHLLAFVAGAGTIHAVAALILIRSAFWV
jgi:uncharacterized membrane protein